METTATYNMGSMKVNSCSVESIIPKGWNDNRSVPLMTVDTYQEPPAKIYPFIPDHGIKKNSVFIQQVTELIEAHLDDETYGITQLCRDYGISRAQLHRNLTAHAGLSASKFIRSIRIRKAIDLLLWSNLNISQVAYEVGFSDPKYFSRLFTKEFNESPRDFRKKRVV